MSIVQHDDLPWQENRPGSRVRLVIDPDGEVTSFGLVYQEVAPGVGAPSHTHDYDEAITVESGEAEVWAGGVRQVVGPGTTLFIPAGRVHGFRNVGTDRLRIAAAMNALELRATFVDEAPGG